MQALRIRALRRLPVAFGWMSKRPLPDALLDRWLEPLQSKRGVRRDLIRYVKSARPREMVEVCERLSRFSGPVLIVWTPEDRVARPEHGKRFHELLPGSRLIEIADSYTLIMRDQPEAFAVAIAGFAREPLGAPVA
jgi:pimeloyl-ACP methyl ester carboxylesterase